MWRPFCLLLIAAAAAAQPTLVRRTDIINLQPLQPPQPATGSGVIEGTAVDASTHEPLRKAEVNLGGTTPINLMAVTDGSGRFVFRSLPAGTYWIRAQKPGYNPSQDALGVQDANVEITLAADKEKKGVEIGLVRDGVISGHIVDEDGMPIRACFVNAVQPYYMQGRRRLRSLGGASPTQAGEYRISSLQPGRYQIFARCQAELPAAHPLLPRGDPRTPYDTYLPQFYGGGLDPSSATTLTLASGASLSDIDFQMRRTPGITVRGTVTGAGPADAQCMVLLLPANELMRDLSQSNGLLNPVNRTFEIRMVIPGSYLLFVTVNHENHAFYARRNVEIGTKPPQPLEVALYPASDLKGTVQFDSDDHPPLENSRVWLQPADSLPIPMQQSQAEIAKDGSFTLSDVLPGRWHISTGFGYIRSMTLGNRPVMPEAFEVPAGGGGTLHIVISTKFSEVNVTIKGAAPNQGSVLMYPEDLEKLGSGLERGMAGNPVSNMVPPGRYRLLGIDSPNAWNLLQRPDVLKALESHTQLVEVPDNGQVKLTVEAISREELTRLIEEKQ